jgi:DNA-binding NtrC family response regulator
MRISMLLFAIVTDRADRFAALNAVISERAGGATVSWHESGASALRSAGDAAPDLMVVDEDTIEISAPAFLRQLMAVNANINTAVASSKALAAFHETYEGLGVLMQLPQEPDRAAAEDLINRLTTIAG